MSCVICEHPQRTLIEQELLKLDSANIDEQLQSIASTYSVSPNDLKRHAICCTPENNTPSIAKQIKLREADILTVVIEEYMATLSLIGTRIRKYTMDEEGVLEKMLTKQVVSLYLGTGAEIRNSVDVLAKMNSEINGPKNETTTGLMALASAIRGSKEE